MPDSYPYTISNNKIEPVLARIRTAAKPDKFSVALLGTWGFTASNDRAMFSVLRELGFLNEGGIPTEAYDELRDPLQWKFALADAIRKLYRDLYAIDPNFHGLSDTEIKATISRITGKEDESVKRYFATFKALANLANFAPRGGKKTAEKSADTVVDTTAVPAFTSAPPAPPAVDHPPRRKATEYHYNIQIHLPVTADISVYNAIFKSLKEHLDV